MAPVTDRVKARFDGNVFVPVEPVNLKPGTEVFLDLPKTKVSDEEWQRILGRTCGAWGDFEFPEIDDPPLQPEEIFED